MKLIFGSIQPCTASQFWSKANILIQISTRFYIHAYHCRQSNHLVNITRWQPRRPTTNEKQLYPLSTKSESQMHDVNDLEVTYRSRGVKFQRNVSHAPQRNVYPSIPKRCLPLASISCSYSTCSWCNTISLGIFYIYMICLLFICFSFVKDLLLCRG